MSCTVQATHTQHNGSMKPAANRRERFASEDTTKTGREACPASGGILITADLRISIKLNLGPEIISTLCIPQNDNIINTSGAGRKVKGLSHRTTHVTPHVDFIRALGCGPCGDSRIRTVLSRTCPTPPDCRARPAANSAVIFKLLQLLPDDSHFRKRSKRLQTTM